jgi:hypothetical protein
MLARLTAILLIVIVAQIIFSIGSVAFAIQAM